MAKKTTGTTKAKKAKINADDMLRKIKEQLAADAAKRETENQKSCRRVLDAAADLHANGIKEIIVHYSGEGDSGDIDFIDVDRSFGDYVLPQAIREAVQNVAWQLIPSGFENNDGGQGKVIFNLIDRTVRVEHCEKIVDYSERSREISFQDIGKEQRSWW